MICPVFAEDSGRSARRPNIVLILADDLGYGDLACYGAKDIQSPNLDKFATQGIRFTQCYAGHPNCSPSRTALMTGRTPTRVGVRTWIPEGSPMHLRRSEVTIATLLRQAGYTTCHSGKWHLNGDFNGPTQPQPSDHGFDYWFSTQNNAAPNHENPDNFVRNGKPVGKLTGYSAQLVADEAIGWLSQTRDKSKPFFLYVCFHEPHEPIATAPEFGKLYPHDDARYTAHHGNITQMDHAFGRLMKSLEDQGLADSTFVMFTSDNGPAITAQHPYGSAGPLRDKKGSIYEGGYRVPGMIRWPGHVAAGQTLNEAICGVDFLPTVCELVGIEPPRDRAIDGTSIAPILAGKQFVRTKPLYWHFDRATSAPRVAMLVGDWKILATLDKVPPTQAASVTVEGEREFHEAEMVSFSLYNLRNDIAEQNDLSTSEPSKLAELKALLQARYREVRDESPVWPPFHFGPPVRKPKT